MIGNLTHDELLDKWRHVIGVHPIPTWTEPLTLAYLCEQASRSEYAIELGTYLGVSAKVMLMANPRLHLWTADHFKAFQWNKEVAAHFLRGEIAEGRCEIIEGDSRRAAEMLRHMTNRIDLIWVDDGHAKEDLFRDITCCRPLLGAFGRFVGHDWEGNNDVAQGVVSVIPMSELTFPVPRCWEWKRKL